MNENARCIKGDFIGFTLGDIHSSELGLMRVSDGSRYNEDLLPPLQDKKAQISGRDGEVYFGSQYMTKPLKVPVAFDNMREEEFSALRRLLSIKTPQVLWFDESPYKQRLVKSATAQSFKWICFDESSGGLYSDKKRIYKGEGTLEFSCFTPYATSRITYLDETKEIKDGKQVYKDEYKNIEEWEKSSRLRYQRIDSLSTETKSITFGSYIEDFKINDFNRRGIFVYNAGDIPIKPKIICKFPEGYKADKDIKLTLYSYNEVTGNINEIEIMEFSKKAISEHLNTITDGENPYLIIDSKLKMIKGAQGNDNSQRLNGRIYNKYHRKGNYLEIPVSNNEIYFIAISEVVENEAAQNTNTNEPEAKISILSIEYTHQYY